MDIREEVERLLSECEERIKPVKEQKISKISEVDFYTSIGYATALSEVINDLKEILGIEV